MGRLARVGRLAMISFRHIGKDRIGGALLALTGVAIVTQGLTYKMGTAVRMGPGYMPVVYGTLIALVGAAIVLTADRGAHREERITSIDVRAWLCILGGLVAFVVLGVYGGLVPATFVAVFIAAMGDQDNSIRDAAVLAAVMVVIATLVFSYGLGLQLPLFRWA